MSQVLRDARRFEEEWEASIAPESRPAFHLSARVGWMNDPNGFSIYQDQYHLFYQYHPYASIWGPMHWGHAVSTDLLHWTYLPAAMAPDRLYDRDGCYSGCAITMKDGRHLLMYTGVQKEICADGIARDIQTQNLAMGDGVNYKKYIKNPVLTQKDLPEGGSKRDFRDPKIWQKKDGSFRALMANDHTGEGGQMLLYGSEDLIHWKFLKVFAENHLQIGRMWECPDFFELDGSHILLASAQDMFPKELEYHNGNGTFYMIGTYDEETETFRPEADYTVDYGIDFYAPQSILTPDGRRVMIGWMQNWDTCNLHTDPVPWFGQMSLPRELSVKNGRLYQQPMRELEAFRKDPVVYENIPVQDEEISLPGVEGRMIDLEVELESMDPANPYLKFALHFAQNEKYHTGLSFRPHESILKIDRKFSGSRRAIIHQRRALVNHENGHVKLRLILDRFSAEVFINDGEKVMSATLYTNLAATGISFFADGGVRLKKVTKYTLEV
ncbi:MAG: glycoside hydrolase family 32 protein [Lachnospiraceae bacterium]|nr:glycoside hydrolase family 32 protein [Lachnospiraceae bacterium]